MFTHPDHAFREAVDRHRRTLERIDRTGAAEAERPGRNGDPRPPSFLTAHRI